MVPTHHQWSCAASPTALSLYKTRCSVMISPLWKCIHQGIGIESPHWRLSKLSPSHLIILVGQDFLRNVGCWHLSRNLIGSSNFQITSSRPLCRSQSCPTDRFQVIKPPEMREFFNFVRLFGLEIGSSPTMLNVAWPQGSTEGWPQLGDGRRWALLRASG